MHHGQLPTDNRQLVRLTIFPFIADGSRPVARYRTSATGTVTVRGLPGAAKTLYVIPTGGSFAIAHVALDSPTIEHGIDITVPDARSALVIRAHDQQGAAMEGVRFVIRYNGEVLPVPIMSLLRYVQHIDYRTTTAGEARVNGLPGGLYELWAYRTPQEADRLTIDPSRYPVSLQLAVAEGTYEAELTFGR
jgi:hypothetical protein